MHFSSVFVNIGKDAKAVNVKYGDALVGHRFQGAADKAEVGEVKGHTKVDVTQFSWSIPREHEVMARKDGVVCPW